MHSSSNQFQKVREYSDEIFAFALKRIKEINAKEGRYGEDTYGEEDIKEVKKCTDMVRSMTNLLFKIDKSETKTSCDSSHESSSNLTGELEKVDISFKLNPTPMEQHAKQYVSLQDQPIVECNTKTSSSIYNEKEATMKVDKLFNDSFEARKLKNSQGTLSPIQDEPSFFQTQHGESSPQE